MVSKAAGEADCDSRPGGECNPRKHLPNGGQVRQAELSGQSECACGVHAKREDGPPVAVIVDKRIPLNPMSPDPEH